MSHLSGTHLGCRQLLSDLEEFLTTYPPEFIAIHDQHVPEQTARAIDSLLQSLSERSNQIVYASIDAIACFTSRLLYDTVINSLAGWKPRWEDGCANWSPSGSEERYNESLDGFLHGLRAVRAAHPSSSVEEIQMVLFVENAERLRESLPELLVPFTRLAELSQANITTIFLSSVRWEDFKPPLGASPEPYRMEVPPYSAEAVISTLESTFPTEPPTDAGHFSPETYAPSLRPLHAHFCRALYNTLAPFTSDPSELAYVASARWPGFVQPVLEEAARQRDALNEEHPEEVGGAGLELLPPNEETRIRLVRHFTPSFTAALEALYPRRTHAAAWAVAHPFGAPADASTVSPGATSVQALPHLAKFVLVAAYLASTNPARSDVRMFGRLDDGSRRKKRKGGGTRKSRGGGNAGKMKVAQRLLGPSPFSLDRLLAILGVLLEEYDADDRGNDEASPYTFPGEETEMELQRVAVYGTISQLASTRLLVRTSQPDKLDGPPMFRAAVSYETVLALAKELKIPLHDLLWESV